MSVRLSDCPTLQAAYSYVPGLAERNNKPATSKLGERVSYRDTRATMRAVGPRMASSL